MFSCFSEPLSMMENHWPTSKQKRNLFDTRKNIFILTFVLMLPLVALECTTAQCELYLCLRHAIKRAVVFHSTTTQRQSCTQTKGFFSFSVRCAIVPMFTLFSLDKCPVQRVEITFITVVIWSRTVKVWNWTQSVAARTTQHRLCCTRTTAADPFD